MSVTVKNLKNLSMIQLLMLTQGELSVSETTTDGPESGSASFLQLTTFYNPNYRQPYHSPIQPRYNSPMWFEPASPWTGVPNYLYQPYGSPYNYYQQRSPNLRLNEQPRYQDFNRQHRQNPFKQWNPKRDYEQQQTSPWTKYPDYNYQQYQSPFEQYSSKKPNFQASPWRIGNMNPMKNAKPTHNGRNFNPHKMNFFDKQTSPNRADINYNKNYKYSNNDYHSPPPRNLFKQKSPDSAANYNDYKSRNFPGPSFNIPIQTPHYGAPHEDKSGNFQIPMPNFAKQIPQTGAAAKPNIINNGRTNCYLHFNPTPMPRAPEHVTPTVPKQVAPIVPKHVDNIPPRTTVTTNPMGPVAPKHVDNIPPRPTANPMQMGPKQANPSAYNYTTANPMPMGPTPPLSTTANLTHPLSATATFGRKEVPYKPNALLSKKGPRNLNFNYPNRNFFNPESRPGYDHLNPEEFPYSRPGYNYYGYGYDTDASTTTPKSDDSTIGARTQDYDTTTSGPEPRSDADDDAVSSTKSQTENLKTEKSDSEEASGSTDKSVNYTYQNYTDDKNKVEHLGDISYGPDAQKLFAICKKHVLEYNYNDNLITSDISDETAKRYLAYIAEKNDDLASEIYHNHYALAMRLSGPDHNLDLNDVTKKMLEYIRQEVLSKDVVDTKDVKGQLESHNKLLNDIRNRSLNSQQIVSKYGQLHFVNGVLTVKKDLEKRSKEYIKMLQSEIPQLKKARSKKLMKYDVIKYFTKVANVLDEYALNAATESLETIRSPSSGSTTASERRDKDFRDTIIQLQKDIKTKFYGDAIEKVQQDYHSTPEFKIMYPNNPKRFQVPKDKENKIKLEIMDSCKSATHSLSLTNFMNPRSVNFFNRLQVSRRPDSTPRSGDTSSSENSDSSIWKRFFGAKQEKTKHVKTSFTSIANVVSDNQSFLEDLCDLGDYEYEYQLKAIGDLYDLNQLKKEQKTQKRR